MKTKTFTWKKLKLKWKNILGNYYYNFVIKDCIGDGNCQFRSIENLLNINGGNFLNYRTQIADYILTIPHEEFQNYLINYRLEYDEGDFEDEWNPYSINTTEEFANEIRKSGFNFQGDEVTLSILTKILHYDFIIMNDYHQTFFTISSEGNNSVIILYYIKKNGYGHYKAVGLINSDKVQTIFDLSNLPHEIHMLISPQSEQDTTDTLNISTPMDIDQVLTSMNSIDLNSDERKDKIAQKIKFNQNKCVSGSGGWLKNELIKFCIILDISYNKNDTKAILCNNIKEYFENQKIT
jgi:hypothetical protein